MVRLAVNLPAGAETHGAFYERFRSGTEAFNATDVAGLRKLRLSIGLCVLDMVSTGARCSEGSAGLQTSLRFGLDASQYYEPTRVSWFCLSFRRVCAGYDTVFVSG